MNDWPLRPARRRRGDRRHRQRTSLNRVAPPNGSLGSAFLVVGRDALAAASNSRADARTRVGLYRVAASSAHYALVEEAATGRAISVPATPPAGKSVASNDAAVSAITIMLQAESEGLALCNSLQANRPPRDCTYLTMARSLANLAVVSQPWLYLPKLTTVNQLQTRPPLVAAFARSPDTEFITTWAAYQTTSGQALDALGALSGGSATQGVAVGPPDYIRDNDRRGFCIVAARAGKIRDISDTPIPGIDMQRNNKLSADAETWFETRYNTTTPPQC